MGRKIRKKVNITDFARLYFEGIGKQYNEQNEEESQSAVKLFKYYIKNGKIDKGVFEKTKAAWLEQAAQDIDDLLSVE